MAQLVRRLERVVRVDQVGRGDVGAAGDMAEATIARAALAPVLFRAQRVDRADAGIADGREHVVPVGNQRRMEDCVESSRGWGRGWSGLDAAGFRAPFLEAAIQDAHTVIPEDAKHPPQARCPPVIGSRVAHHMGVIADAECANASGKPLWRRQHEVQGSLLRRVGQVVVDVGEPGARDVAQIEVRPTRNDVVRPVGAGQQMGGGVQDHDPRVCQVGGEPGGIDQECGVGHWRRHGVVR